MKMNKGVIAPISSFVTSIGLALSVYYSLASKSGVTIGTVILMAGLVMGVVHGWFFDLHLARRIGIAAFLALCLLWTPIVIGTYGFALMALPILAIYAFIVFVGAQFGARNRLWGESDA
jgi:hypothetical protein